MRLFGIILNNKYMENSVRQRIKQFIENNNISINALSKGNSALQRKLQRQVNEGASITIDTIEYLQGYCPRLNSEWLLRGRGEMYLPESADANQGIQETRPRIPYDAAAGALTVGVDGVMEYECEQVPLINTLPKYDFTILVRGESMMPEIQSGDEIACALISESAFIQWGRVHVLDTSQGIVVKRIYEKGDGILCKSDNLRYSEYVIPKSEIYHIALVVGLIRHY